MGDVSYAAKTAAILLIISLVGCGTPSSQRVGISDWRSADYIEPAKPTVPVPTNAPAATVKPPVQIPKPALAAVPEPVIPGDTNRYETWMSLNRWCQNHALPGLVRHNDPVYFSLASGRGTLLLAPWNNLVRWQGMDLHLGFSPQLINGDLFVNGLDLKKTIRPLLNGPVRPGLVKGRTIVIDPGHGGIDAGASSVPNGYHEKDLTLDWARRLEQLLTAQGWQVFLTRTNDMDLALSNRVAVADQHAASVFISLHFNSGHKDNTSSGIETYCMTPAGVPSTVTRGFPDDLSASHKNNEFDEGNLLLACRVHQQLLRIPGVRDRGIRRARFLGVLKGQQRPAILVEGGYLSNPTESRLVNSAAHRQKLAAAIAAALMPDAPPVIASSTAIQTGTNQPSATPTAN